jgi:toxin CcdB
MQFTVYKNPSGNGYLLDLQANVNDNFTTRVVAPLLPIKDVPHYASSLNPVFEIKVVFQGVIK